MIINELFRTDRVRVRELAPSSFNPRKIKAAEKQKLLHRLEKYGMISIPVRDFDGTLLGGKQRCEILMQFGLGETEVDVRTAIRKLTEEELKEVMLIENSHAGEWDMEVLRKEFESFVDLDEFNIMLEESANDIEKELTDSEDRKSELPIVAKMSEKYTAIVVVCTNEIDLNHIAEKLGLEMEKCYKSNSVGISRVVSAQKLIEAWKL